MPVNYPVNSVMRAAQALAMPTSGGGTIPRSTVVRGAYPAGITYTTTREGNLVTVRVTSDLPHDATIYYHWYVDGAYAASTAENVFSFTLIEGEVVEIVCLDTTDPDFDPVANAPAGYPGRRRLWWMRSLETGVAWYRVEQKLGAGTYAAIGRVRHDDGQWQYELLTPQLQDLGTYTWRAVPIDTAGNDRTAIDLGSEKIVRVPDPPDFTAEYDSGTARVTFAAA